MSISKKGNKRPERISKPSEKRSGPQWSRAKGSSIQFTAFESARDQRVTVSVRFLEEDPPCWIAAAIESGSSGRVNKPLGRFSTSDDAMEVSEDFLTRWMIDSVEQEDERE